MKITFLFVVSMFLFLYKPTLVAQTETDTLNEQNNSESAISISGEIGTYGEVYNISNIPNRRPKSTGRLFLRPTLDILGLIQLPFEILVSTEGNSARQNINQFGLNPKWSWGSAHIGDFNENYSNYTLSGVKIRGGGLNINPGFFRFSIASGFTSRAVNGGAQNGSFERFLLAGKLGFGNEDETNFNIILLKAKDKISSIDNSIKSITVLEPNGDDVWPLGTLQTIKWNSVNIGGALNIEISRDGGNTFEQIGSNIPNIGFYEWSVTGAASLQALVKITSVDEPEVSDVSDFLFSIGTGTGFTFTKGNRLTEIVNPNSVTPQENLVLGISGKARFLENTIVFDYEASGSLYSRDLRSSKIDLDSSDFPQFLSKIFAPRVSSNYDFALNTQLQLNLKSYNGKVSFKRIGPGYNSLGLAYLLNDQQEIGLMNSFRISNFAFTLGFTNQRDNLNDQKLYTTNRNIYLAGISGQFSEFWNASLMVNVLQMGNNSNADSVKTDFNNFVVSSSQSFMIGQTSLLRSVMLTYVFQSSENKSFKISNNTTLTHTLNGGVNFYFNQNFNSTISAGFLNSAVFDTIKNTIKNLSVVIQHNGFDQKLNSSINLSVAFSEISDSFRGGITTAYHLSSADSFTLAVWFTRFNGADSTRSSFSEILSSLNYSHRF